MKTVVDNIKESRDLLDDFFADLDDYEKIFESVTTVFDDVDEKLEENEIISKIKDLIEKYNSYMSTDKNPSIAEAEEKIYLNVANQLQKIINGKDF